MKFAKIYDYDDGTQILITIDINGDRRPSVRISFKPSKIGICKVESSYDATVWGEAVAKEYFESLDKETALKKVVGFTMELGL